VGFRGKEVGIARRFTTPRAKETIERERRFHLRAHGLLGFQRFAPAINACKAFQGPGLKVCLSKPILLVYP
jgi:hypothetical protein